MKSEVVVDWRAGAEVLGSQRKEWVQGCWRVQRTGRGRSQSGAERL